MLKILIIDDDALTRKGIQTLMPWNAHNMEIIGEASNGKNALEFLADHDVDLVLVDLDMPIMDGMTFIEQAKSLYPNLNYVVLTIHTEFEYIQNALRMGAIDYIAKTQFDQENFDQILNRINSSISKKLSQKQVLNPKWKESKILYPFIYVLITMETESDEHIYQFWDMNGLSGRSDIVEIISGGWVFTDERSTFLFPECFPNTTLLCISDVSDLTYSQLGALLRNYKKEQFFYDYQPLLLINHKRAFELQESTYITDEASLESLKNEWISLNWVYRNELFDKIKFDLKNSKLTFSKLYHLLLSLENVWNASYSQMTGQSLELPTTFYCWEEVEAWLISVYEKTNMISASSKYSQDITNHILAVKQYIDSHFSANIVTSEIARKAHMSYGYFSRCFHDIIGISFSDYCIQLRINKAKDYLLSTDEPIQKISFCVGYNDEKYFSRLFKKITGYSPSDYRKLHTED